jgi:ABC-type xylose transport system permease subunit
MPILMVAACALALVMTWGAATAAVMPAANSRLVSFIQTLPGTVLFAGSYWFIAPHARKRSTPSGTYEVLKHE